MKKIVYSFYGRLKYNFDNLMSKGTFAPLILLLISATLVILVIALILMLLSDAPSSEVINDSTGILKNNSFLFSIYVTLLRMLDPGVISGDPFYIGYFIITLVATLSGLFIISTLIAIVNSGVMQKLGDLRKGKSLVYEENHTVILGWSPQVFPIISELIIANENQKKASIAILAPKDKVYMEDEIRAKVGETKNTKIVCRTGDPIDLNDLNIVNLNKARSIIVTAPDSDDPDSMVIKTILAITNNPNRKPLPEKYHIVAEIRDPRNVVIAEIAGQDEVQLVIFDYLISRITAQTCRQPGLSVVFTELLDFSGDEIYFQNEPRLYGKTFVEAMFSYETSCVMGIRKADGTILIKPPFDTIIENGDMVIAISEDDDTVVLSGLKEFNIDYNSIKKTPPKEVILPENTLIIGWNRRSPLIINELDNYVAAGSKLTILANHPKAESELATHCSDLTNQSVSFWFGDTTNRKILDDLNIATYDHIIVLSSGDSFDVQESDAKTLSTLLHLRDISNKKGHKFSIVSEMLDDRNRELAEVTHTDDFIVSVKLDSLMLSQISENQELKEIFEDLFSAGGPAIFIKPAENYVELGRAVNFYTVMEAARRQNQIAIGVKLDTSKQKSQGIHYLAHGVAVNPIKSHQLFFAEGDKIIILSEESEG